MDFQIYPATRSDAVSLAPRLRESDVREMTAAYGMKPEAALLESLRVSDDDMCWVAKLGDLPIAMFGVNNLGNDTGGIWMLCSDDIYANKKDFMRHCWKHLMLMHERYPHLTNFVDIRHTTAMRWLRKLGFSAVQFLPNFGHQGRPFLQYTSEQV